MLSDEESSASQSGGSMKREMGREGRTRRRIHLGLGSEASVGLEREGRARSTTERISETSGGKGVLM